MTSIEDMFYQIEDSLSSFAKKYENIPVFRGFFDAMKIDMTYREFYDWYRKICALEDDGLTTADIRQIPKLKLLMINYMYARREAGDGLHITTKTADPQVVRKKEEETPQVNIMSARVSDVRNMKFEQTRQDTIDKWMQDMSIEEVERKILKVYSGKIMGWNNVLSDKFEMKINFGMKMSLDANALCAIVCRQTGGKNDITEYEAIVTWPRDNREEIWQLEFRNSPLSVYYVNFMQVRSPAVAATPGTPDDDRYILATFFPKMQACKDILSIYFRNESFRMDCVWEGRVLCTLDCREEDISFPRAQAAIRGATVADDRHILATQENLTVYNLVVQWARQQPDESWTLKVAQTGHKPKTVIEFRYNDPNSAVTDVQHDRGQLKEQACRIAGLLQRLGAMATI